MSLELSMDSKTNGPQTLSVKRKTKLFGFLHAVKDELKKVTWTSASELKFFTKIVIGSTFAFGLGVYLGDLIIKNMLDGITMLFHWIVG